VDEDEADDEEEHAANAGNNNNVDIAEFDGSFSSSGDKVAEGSNRVGEVEDDGYAFSTSLIEEKELFRGIEVEAEAEDDVDITYRCKGRILLIGSCEEVEEGICFSANKGTCSCGVKQMEFS
jgi:uncharacterized protein YaiE (UPF0345 family)